MGWIIYCYLHLKQQFHIDKLINIKCWYIMTFVYLLLHTFFNWNSKFDIKNLTKNDVIFIVLLIYLFMPFMKRLKITLPNGTLIHSETEIENSFKQMKENYNKEISENK